MMKCQVCGNDTSSTDSNRTLCSTCQQLKRSDLFLKILSILLNIYSANKGFDAVKDKCTQLDTIIKKHPLFVTSFCTFDPEEHDTDRTALHYLRTYVISEDNNILQKHYSVKFDTSNSDGLYKTIALLCRLDIEDGAIELRVRNVVDMVLNAEVYYSADPELHSSLQWGETWRHFVLEQLREKPLINGPNAVLTLALHSLSGIINMRIRSVYPKVPGTSDDLRKRLDRIFSPLDIHLSTNIVPTISILWSNTKHMSLHSASTRWLPNCVVPLLPKPDCYTNNAVILPRATSADLQNPAERSFYVLSCFCSITQSMLNELVSYSDQQKHSEAEMNKSECKLPAFRCPKCAKLCNNYGFDWRAVALFRQNFSGTRFTYILVDTTSSMTSDLPATVKNDQKSSSPRIVQTKEAIKQLLAEIAAGATASDQAILTTFDEKLTKPAIIPLCQAIDIAQDSNLTRIDTIILSPRSVKTCFYLVLKEIYEMLERQPFLYVDLYLFSDGIDTSRKKDDKAYQAIIRGLNEKLGVKCHFMNCSSGSNGFSVAAWLGDVDADCPISGSNDEIKTQIKAAYKKDHTKNPNLISARKCLRGDTFDSSSLLTNTYMTDAEASSVRKPRSTETLSSDSTLQNSDENRKTFYDYIPDLPSATTARLCSVTTPDSKSDSSGIFNMVQLNRNVRKLK